MKTKHTKGKWEIIGFAGEHDEAGAAIKCNDEFICTTSHVRNNNWDEYYANAKLIAAAPELLEALISMREIVTIHVLYPQIKLMDDAIKKATK